MRSTVNGRTLWENVKDAPCWNREVITPFEEPFKPRRRHGDPARQPRPDGAVIKPSAASPELMQHTGRAVVFENIEDLHQRIDDDGLDIDASCIMVLKNCGPKGYPGMAEVGNMPLPPKLLQAGRARHGPHLGRAHVRHGLRHRGAARRARGGGRRAAGAGAERRPDHARRGSAQPASARGRGRARSAPGRLGAAAAPMPSAGYVKIYVDHVLQADQGRRPRLPGRPHAARRSRATITDSGNAVVAPPIRGGHVGPYVRLQRDGNVATSSGEVCMSQTIHRYKGVFPVAPTMFRDDGELDLEARSAASTS